MVVHFETATASDPGAWGGLKGVGEHGTVIRGDYHNSAQTIKETRLGPGHGTNACGERQTNDGVIKILGFN